ncbi:MAG: butyrate kinase [Myxococcales bacterium]|nr:MAG: butyrate kinase [Myxococcales bacterium]
MPAERLLVINPGGITTRLAYFEGEREALSATLEHDPADLSFFSKTLDQLPYRQEAVNATLREWKLNLNELKAVVSRGGPLTPLPAGVYLIDGTMVADIWAERVSADHPSLLGCIMALELASYRGKPAYVVDPVSVDEMDDAARVSGLAGLPRHSLWHALNSRYVARIVCERRGVKYEETNLVVVHLGSGISVSAHRKGRAVDVSNPNEMGPFSPARAGGVPTTGLASLCFGGEATHNQVIERLTKKGGLVDHLKTADLREVERRIDLGDRQADLVYRAMAYQVAKEIGAMAIACGGPSIIAITGGLAYSERFVRLIAERVVVFAPVEVVPGEMEMEALAAGALRVLRGQEKAKSYKAYRNQ